MKYYAIEFDKSLYGSDGLFQVDEVKHNCDPRNDPDFIDKHPFRYIDKKPILSYPVVRDSFDLTDILKVSSVGFSYGSMVISDKLKSILERHYLYGIQFFETQVIKSGNYYNNYWQTHLFDSPFDKVDFKNSRVMISNRDKNHKKYIEQMEVDNWLDFISISKELRYPQEIYIDKICFKIDLDYDYFHLRYFRNGGSRGMVSETLKNEIQSNDISGILFRPIEVPLTEWLKKRYAKN